MPPLLTSAQGPFYACHAPNGMPPEFPPEFGMSQGITKGLMLPAVNKVSVEDLAGDLRFRAAAMTGWLDAGRAT